MQGLSHPLLAIIRALGFVAWTILAVVPYLVMLAFGYRNYGAYTRRYFRGVVRVLGFQVDARGQSLAGQKSVLYVANHASYLDIVILGSLLDACFVAKAEVAGWPGFGFLSRIGQTVFVDRKRKGSGKERDLLRARLEQGDSLVLFPEGTSNDGNRVLPFKSSLFSVAEQPVSGQDIRIQPISLAYNKLDGIPMGRGLRPFVAWYGDMTLAGHLFAAMGLGRVGVSVQFHDPITLAEYDGRKGAALAAWKSISDSSAQMLYGDQRPNRDLALVKPVKALAAVEKIAPEQVDHSNANGS